MLHLRAEKYLPSAIEWKTVPGHSRAPDEFQARTVAVVAARGPLAQAVVWGLTVSARSVPLIKQDGEVLPSALFGLGIACQWLAIRAMWRRAIARIGTR